MATTKWNSNEFDEEEQEVLSTLYQSPDGRYGSHQLYLAIYADVQIGTPEAGKAFTMVRDATERLIGKSLVRGERMAGIDGVYWNNLKLTSKGEQAAIREKNRVKEIVTTDLTGVDDAKPKPPDPKPEFDPE